MFIAPVCMSCQETGLDETSLLQKHVGDEAANVSDGLNEQTYSKFTYIIGV